MFEKFADAVQKRFDDLAKEALFVVDADRDLIWQIYLASFPPGTDPLFRVRTEHDCSCCRHFIRDIGAVVAIQNGALASVWDLNGLPSPYQEVADAMAAYVKALPIRDGFLTRSSTHGTLVTPDILNGVVHQWHHFAVDIPRAFRAPDDVARRGAARTTFGLLWRGLTELRPEDVATVADLIKNKAIYRGDEFKASVEEFQRAQERILAIDGEEKRKIAAWTLVGSSVARFRNTVIGTLVQDLSSGADVEVAVRLYEAKVAPQNYKRPTALITKGMVDKAMKAIDELGLEPALERRHARLSDVDVNSVLFVDNSVREVMKGGVRDLLVKEVKPAPFDQKKAEEIGVDDFMANVLPKATGLQVFLENRVMGNFVSMTAPVHDGVEPIFRWGNDFAWSYDGNVTDSIKERVKRAGGQVEGVELRVSLAWFNTDDLDLHVFEPDGNHIYYGNKGGKLDVDMNVTAVVRDAVENVRWIHKPRSGRHRVFVHQFTKRESIDVGFVVEVEHSGGVETFRFEKALAARKEQPVVDIDVGRDGGISLTPATGIKVGSISQEKWGLKTLNLVKVNSVVLSPNYWGENGGEGNKHWFFILDGCRNPEPCRGIYNEFLHPRLQAHRKVFEVLGDKTKCPVVDDQMSGVGFSSTKREKLTVMATGPKLNKAYTICF